MAVTFRLISVGEVEHLRDVAAKSFLAAYAGQIEDALMHDYLGETHSTEVLTKELATEGTYYYFAIHEGIESGFLMLEHPQTHPGLDLKPAVFIHRIYLLPEYWSLGLGSEMMAFCEAFARERGADWIWLQVWRENLRALKFYRRWGFEEFATTDFILGEVVHDDLLLKRPVPTN